MPDNGEQVVTAAERLIVGGDYHIGFRVMGQRPYRMTAHRHQGVHELVYCMAGGFEHIINGRRCQHVAGEAVFIREQDEHELVFAQCKAVNIAFRPALLDDLLACADDGRLAQAILDVDQPRFVRLGAMVDRSFTRAVLAMLRHHNDGRSHLRFTRFLLDALADIYAERCGAVGKALPQWLDEALVQVGDLPNHELSIDNLVACCGRSREHVARTLRRHLGTTPSAWLNGQRLERAADLLTTTERQVTDIAFAVGFESLNYFYQLFKRSYRQSPRQFRLRQRTEVQGC